MRIGVIRALFVKPTPGAAAVSDGINRELKVLQSLGAELVEDVDPEYPDDPSIPNMTFGFNDAFAEVLPFHMPEIFSWKKDGKPQFSLRVGTSRAASTSSRFPRTRRRCRTA